MHALSGSYGTSPHAGGSGGYMGGGGTMGYQGGGGGGTSSDCGSHQMEGIQYHHLTNWLHLLTQYPI